MQSTSTSAEDPKALFITVIICPALNEEITHKFDKDGIFFITIILLWWYFSLKKKNFNVESPRPHLFGV